MKYDFPVTNKRHAREVTELDFRIDPVKSNLYVELDDVRGKDYLEQIRYTLNIIDEKLDEVTDTYTKIIFSGHKGTGKTLELMKFHDYAGSPDRYFSIFIEFEKEFEIPHFQPEDLFVILITKLIESADEKDIKFESKYLLDLMMDWISEEEIKKELKDTFKLDIGTEIEAGASFPVFLKLKSKLKAIFSSESNTSRLIRQKIKKNPKNLIDRFNYILTEIREVSQKNSLGMDILFILDGTERIPYDTYFELFVKDSNLIRAINCNMIFSVPIHSYYNIESSPHTEFFHTYTLPMVPLKNKSIPKLQEIVSKRLNADVFFTKDALKFCVEKSGGCIRQLLRIVNRALIISLGEKVTKSIAQKSTKELGMEMRDKLDSEHIDIIKKGNFKTADKKVLELLFDLVVLKYNGHRDINPLIKDVMKI